MECVKRRAPQATVIGDSDANSAICEIAENVGRLLAQMRITVVTGGCGGIMEAASKGASREGGLVIGILPTAEMSHANPWCDVVIPTGLGHARNAITSLAGDFVVAIGGAAGTLSEICFGWIHGKSIFVLGGSGGWSDRLRGQVIDGRCPNPIISCESIESLKSHLLHLYGDTTGKDSGW